MDGQLNRHTIRDRTIHVRWHHHCLNRRQTIAERIFRIIDAKLSLYE